MEPSEHFLSSKSREQIFLLKKNQRQHEPAIPLEEIETTNRIMSGPERQPSESWRRFSLGRAIVRQILQKKREKKRTESAERNLPVKDLRMNGLAFITHGCNDAPSDPR